MNRNDQQFMAQKIRTQYMEKTPSELDALRELDARVQMAGTIPSLCIGIVGALVFGLGMCFFLDVFAGAAWLTALLMVLGAVIMIPAYPIYRRIARKTKAELTPEILRLSDEIIKF